jgi:hypothetical protein
MNANKYSPVNILSLCALILMPTGIYCVLAKEDNVAAKSPRLDEEDYQVARNMFNNVQKAIVAGDIATVKSNCDGNFLLLISGKETGTSPRGIDWSKAKKWFMSNQAEAILARGSRTRMFPGSPYPIIYPLSGFKEKYSAFIEVSERQRTPRLYAKFDTGVETIDTRE